MKFKVLIILLVVFLNIQCKKNNVKDEINSIPISINFDRFDKKFYDIDSGFKIFDKKKLSKILLTKKINNHFYMSEICLKMIYAGSSFKEVHVKYFQRPTKSRALPILKIPGMSISYLKNFLKLKKILDYIKNNFNSLA